MTTIIPVICRACVRIQSGGTTCQAFPDGIPVDIAMRGADHRQARDGDGGLRFEPASGDAAEQAFAEWRHVFSGADPTG